MPGLSYPYRFQCKKCGEHIVTERSDARDLYDDPDSHSALNAVLKDRDWIQAFSGFFCPDCAGEKD